MLPSVPPPGQSPVIRQGMAGWPVYALQTFLNSVSGAQLLADGAFGGKTYGAVAAFQSANGLVSDGIAGPATQARLVVRRIEAAEAANPALPDGLLKGKLLSEGGLLLAPVNWSVGGGVDCGAAQYRVFGPPYQAVNGGVTLKEAFGPVCVRMAADDFLARRGTFMSVGAWSRANPERAGRCAALAHNWPSAGGADYYAQHGHVMNPDGACSWLPRDRAGNLIVRFPDGVLVRTRQEWAEFYAMAGAHGEGAVTRFVTSWT